jgi:hypothetical protein
MKHVRDTDQPPGTVVVAAATQPRFYEFTQSLEHLIAPEGSKQMIVRSCDITQNFNDGIRKMTGEWVWFVGDDHAFEENILMRLLSHNVDVVVPITPCKSAPWMPCMMHGLGEGFEGEWQTKMPLYHWDELSDGGLFELPKYDFIGQACMLVRKSVLDKIGDPWFKCGQLDPGRLQEDLHFCKQLQELNYTVWVDTDIIFDHYFINCVTARKYQGKWCPALKALDGSAMVIPSAKPKELELHKQYSVGNAKIKWAPLPTESEYVA